VIRDEVIIREINALWLPVYPYMADHLLAASGVGGGRFLDLGPFAGGLALNILRKCETFVVAVRGAFFFLTPTLLQEVRRVLRPGGFGWVGGGYGPTTPDEVIASIAHRSRMLNEAVGKRRITPEDARVMAGIAGLEECTRVVTEGGLWLEVRA